MLCGHYAKFLAQIKRRKSMDRRQFANECEGCRQNGVECRLWNEGICHEQNYYEEELPQGAKNTEQSNQPDSGE